MKRKIKSDLLKDLLLKLLFEGDKIPNIQFDTPNKLIRKINSSKLSQELNHSWINYFKKGVDLISFQDNLGEKYRDWQIQKSDLANIRENAEMIDFVNKYFGNDIQLGYNLGDISNKEIIEIVNYIEPNVSANFKGKYNRIYNFKFLNINQLHLMLHIRFDSFKGDSFIVTTIYSFWFDKPEDQYNLDSNYINDWYYCHNLSRKLMTKLEIHNYEKLNIFNLESLTFENTQKNEGFSWPKMNPELLITYVKKTLNANPIKIIEKLVEEIKEINGNVLNYKDKYPINPDSWFENLSEELKLFYNRGKEIFLHTSTLIESKSSEELIELEKKFPESRNKLSFENIIFLFNRALEFDLKKNQNPIEAGYRTRKRIFDEFLNRKTRNEKYNFIEPVSKGTFYSTFNKYENELNAVLEKDSSRGKGGGDAYRIRKPEIRLKNAPHLVSDEDLDSQNVEFKEEIHEGLVYYDEETYEDAIKVFGKILTSDIFNPSTMKSEFLGVKYALGKSYMKIGLFEMAKKQFESIFKLDKTKLDNKFKLLICLYNMGIYDKAEKVASNLFEEVGTILSPYSSLEENHKDILYKEDLSFFHPYLENIHPNLYKKDIFSKNLIMMNRYYQEIPLMHLRPKFDIEGEDYQKKMEEFEDIKYFIGNNVSFYRKLKLIQLNVEKYMIEIIRKVVTRKLLLSAKEDDFYNFADDKLTNLNKYIIEGNLKIESVENVLNYFVKLSQLYYKNEVNPISENIEQNFGKFDNKLKRGGFPDHTRFIPYFLYLATSVLNTNNFDWAHKDLHKNFDIPELELELFCLELYQIKEIELPKIEKEIELRLANFNVTEDVEITHLFEKWRYEITFFQYSGIRQLLLKLEKYIELVEKSESRIFKIIITKFSSEIKQRFEIIQNLQSKGRKKALNKIFSKLSKGFKIKINLENVDYSLKPEKFYYKFFPLKITDQIFAIFRNFLGENKVTLKLFNQKISEYVYNEIKSQIKEPDTCDLDLKANKITIQKYRETNFRGNVLFFQKYLDYFFNDLFDTIKIGSDKLILRYSVDFEKLLAGFFTEKFLSDTKNPYFKFSIEHNSQNHYYFIKIIEKEVS